MGVIRCTRNNCENTMINRHSSAYGNLCGECFEQLVRLGVTTDINDFMDSQPNRDPNAEATELYFNEIFPRISSE